MSIVRWELDTGCVVVYCCWTGFDVYVFCSAVAYWYIAFIYNYRCGCVFILSGGVTWFVTRDGLMWFEYSVFLMDTVMMSS